MVPASILPLRCKEGSRRVITINESKIKIEGQWRYLWAAIDVDTWEVLAVWITRGRSGLEARMFIREVLRKCRGRPRVLVDGGPWYRWALDSLGLVWEHVTFGERNPVEQWFGVLKQRIKRFYKRWPHNATIVQAQWWIESFVALY
ncbi:MAG: IS6 family transposase, partial [Candidatus Thorarchaeota archaeon]